MQKPKIYGNIVVPSKDRKMKDIFFYFLFLLYWIGMIVLSLFAFRQGNIQKLTFALDSEGNYCGTINTNPSTGEIIDFTDQPLVLYMFNPSDPDLKTYSYKRCVRECPTSSESIECKLGIEPSEDPVLLAEQLERGDCFRTYEAIRIVNRCIPINFESALMHVNESKNKTRFSSSYLHSLRKSIYGKIKDEDLFGRLAEDIVFCWNWIAAACIFALLLSIFWLFIIRCMTGILVACTIGAAILITFGVAGYFWYVYLGYGRIAVADEFLGEFSSVLSSESTVFLIAIISSVLCLLFLFLVIISRSRLIFTIDVIKRGGHAVSALPSLLLVPIIKNFCAILLFCYGCGVVLLLATCGQDISTALSESLNASFSWNISPTTIYRLLFVYFGVGLFWTYNVILAIGTFCIASTVANWYFTPSDRRGMASGINTLLKSYYRALRFHFGSLAFGSLIIALFTLIRFLLERLHKELNLKKSVSNPFLLGVIRGLSICFGFLERLIRYLNSNAYVEIAIYGDSFVEGLQRAGSLISANSFRSLVLESFAFLIMFAVKISVTLLTVFVTSVFLNNMDLPEVFYALTLAIVALLSYIIASAFISLLETSFATIFICFLEDCEISRYEQSVYMGNALSKYAVNAKLESVS